MAKPSILDTYTSAFKLYKKSYIAVLPFTFVTCVLIYLLTIFFPMPQPTQVPPSAATWATALAAGFLALLNFNILLLAIFAINQNSPLDYLGVLKQALSRFLPMFASLLLLIVPCAIGVFLTMFILIFIPFLHSFMYGIAFLVIAFASIILVGYFYVSTLEIVVNKKGPIAGLKRSWELSRHYVMKTFLVFMFFVIPLLLIKFILLQFVDQAAAQLIEGLIFYPLGPALLVVYHEKLTTA